MPYIDFKKTAGMVALEKLPQKQQILIEKRLRSLRFLIAYIKRQ